MKRKLTALILAAASALCMCGCGSKELPKVFSDPVSMAVGITKNDIDIITVDNDIMDKCFEKIKIGPAVLTLPMNVSDLPEGIVCRPGKYYDQSVNSYNGIKVLASELYIGESDQSIGYAKIICSDAEKYSDGMIAALIVYSMDANAVLGDISLNMSYDDISKAFGCGGESDRGCVYVSRDGRSVFFSSFSLYYSYSEGEAEYPDYVCISTDTELYANDIM